MYGQPLPSVFYAGVPLVRRCASVVRRCGGVSEMCGIVGLWCGTSCASLKDRLHPMVAALGHRGPDGAGIWTDGDHGLALGHTRLAIIDLSDAGAQPMCSPDGRYVLTFNGEIYNCEDIRSALMRAGLRPQWQGHSDTEVLLAAFGVWGVTRTLKKCNGMFALGLWDRKTRSLTLARDRMGEKPLYYGRIGKEFVFASELVAFYRHTAWQGEIDRGALALMMRHNCVPAPYSIFKNVRKLEPGTIVVLNDPLEYAETSAYWDVKEVYQQGLAAPFEGSPDAAVDGLEEVLGTAVRRQMMSDVPLGAFLSGGIDSSTVVALMQKNSAVPVNTFSIGFEVKGYDEAVYAREVAQHLGTHHTELYVSAERALNVIPKLPSIYSEPFSDSSQIPTFLLSEMTGQHVTVSLSGDGGDELFSGYSRYGVIDALCRKHLAKPNWLRKSAAALLLSVPAGWMTGVGDVAQRVLPRHFHVSRAGDKAHKLAHLMQINDPLIMYRDLVSHWQDPTSLVRCDDEPPTKLTGMATGDTRQDFIKRVMLMDLMTYLPDDILVKLDRAAMSVGLETRVPLLDSDVVSFAARLPINILRKDNVSKWPLRSLLCRYVPKRIIDRPKMGFGIPMATWLRHDLRDWAEDLLSDAAFSDGYFHAAPARGAWQQYLAGDNNSAYPIWDVLMFQSWLRHYRSL